MKITSTALFFVFENDLQAFVQVARDLESQLDDLWIKLDFRKDRRVRSKEHSRPGAAGGAKLLERSDRLALLESNLPLRAVTTHSRHQLL